MSDFILLGIAGAVVILILLTAAALFLLKREQKKLKQAYQSLTTQIQRSSDDIAGLCAAAVAVDRRLSVNESYLSELREIIDIQQHKEEFQSEYGRDSLSEVENDQPQVYEQAIEKIRHGATVDELVRGCGLTRDEAVLLVRLHLDR